MEEKREYTENFLLSFLIILGIPIVASTFFYTSTMDMVKRQSDRMGQNILRMTKNDIDAYLEGARKFESRWYMDENVKEIADIQGEISREHAQTMLDIFRELVKQTATENNLKKAFIWFRGSDKVISTDGNMDFDMYYELYIENDQISAEGFRELLGEHHQYDTIVLTGSDGSKKPVMMLSLKNSRLETDAATIGLVLDQKEFRKAFRQRAVGKTA